MTGPGLCWTAAQFPPVTTFIPSIEVMSCCHMPSRTPSAALRYAPSPKRRAAKSSASAMSESASVAVLWSCTPPPPHSEAKSPSPRTWRLATVQCHTVSNDERSSIHTARSSA